jgi:hypothetical protein
MFGLMRAIMAIFSALSNRWKQPALLRYDDQYILLGAMVLLGRPIADFMAANADFSQLLVIKSV